MQCGEQTDGGKGRSKENDWERKDGSLAVRLGAVGVMKLKGFKICFRSFILRSVGLVQYKHIYNLYSPRIMSFDLNLIA